MFTDSAVLEGAWGNNPHYCSLHWHHWGRERGASTWLQSCLAACHCEVLLTVKGEIPPVRTGVPIQATSCVEMRASPNRPPPLLPVFVRYLANKKNNFVFAVTGSAVWEDGGAGGQRSALQPVHGGELGVTECPSLLHEADQRDFPQWGHESHVSPINTCLIYRLGSIEGEYVWS